MKATWIVVTVLSGVLAVALVASVLENRAAEQSRRDLAERKAANQATLESDDATYEARRVVRRTATREALLAEEQADLLTPGRVETRESWYTATAVRKATRAAIARQRYDDNRTATSEARVDATGTALVATVTQQLVDAALCNEARFYIAGDDVLRAAGRTDGLDAASRAYWELQVLACDIYDEANR